MRIKYYQWNDNLEKYNLSFKKMAIYQILRKINIYNIYTAIPDQFQSKKKKENKHSQSLFEGEKN